MKAKKKFKKLKTSAISRMKQIKHGQMSLKMKMFFLLGVFATLLGGVNILNMVVGANFMFRNYFAQQLEHLTAGANADITEGASSMEAFFNNLEEKHHAELDSLRAGSGAPLAKVADEVTSAAAFYGYFILSPDGTVLECTDGHEGLSRGSSAKGIMQELDADGNHNGFAQVCDFGLCSIVAHTIYSADGEEPAGVIGVILSNVTDKAYLEGLKSRYQIELALLKNGAYTVSTIKSEDGTPSENIRIEDEAVRDSVYHSHVPYIGLSDIEGRGFVAHYVPIMSKDGTMLGTLFTGIELSRSEALMKWLVLAMFVGGLLFSFLVIAIVFRHVKKNITGPIGIISEAARKVAEKDLTSEVKLFSTGDEIELLAASVFDMQESLRDTLEEIQDAATSLKTQSQEISRASMSISDGANSQASALEEIASSVDEMTSMIHQNTDNSKKTDKLMAETDASIANIAEISNTSLAASKKIASAIRNINALVSQTNILSLNASVEAARAGSHGRGFAVVAKEVGRLAEQTKATAASVSETAEASIGASIDVDTKLDEVTPQLHQVVALMKEITVSSVEQEQGAEHINLAIADLNKTTQQNAAGAEELAASAQELAASAQELNNIANEFKV